MRVYWPAYRQATSLMLALQMEDGAERDLTEAELELVELEHPSADVQLFRWIMDHNSYQCPVCQARMVLRGIGYLHGGPDLVRREVLGCIRGHHRVKDRLIQKGKKTHE